MTRLTKRLALTGLAACLAVAPECTPTLKALAGAALTAALSVLTGCLSPGSMSPSSTNNAPTQNASPASSQTASQNQSGSPVNVTIGEAWPAKRPPTTGEENR